MGQIQQVSDPTGRMSQEKLNSQDIQNLIDEFNRTQQIGNNQLSLFTDGSTNRYEVGYQTNGWGNGKNVGIKASKVGVEVTTAPDNSLTYKDDFSTKTWYDASNPRILEGLLPDSSYGMWVSKPGVDVTTATTDQLIFNSNQNVFKIIKSGTINVAVPVPLPAGHVVTGTVPHGLSFIPAFQAFVTIPATSSFVGAGQLTHVPNSLYNSNSGGADIGALTMILAQARADATNLYLDVVNVSSVGIVDLGTPWVFKYYIFQETAS